VRDLILAIDDTSELRSPAAERERALRELRWCAEDCWRLSNQPRSARAFAASFRRLTIGLRLQGIVPSARRKSVRGQRRTSDVSLKRQAEKGVQRLRMLKSPYRIRKECWTLEQRGRSAQARDRWEMYGLIVSLECELVRCALQELQERHPLRMVS